LTGAKRSNAIRRQAGATIARMLDDLEALRSKLTELNARVRNLREENQQLRSQLSSAQTELESARGRVSVAVSRVDELLARLPAVEPAAAAGSAINVGPLGGVAQ
jgi:chromosome segregation ATPase